ncbi:hypothetical protein KY285_033691 [Solanum tuberosum]|nr:hypothetical protein KY284_033531 [Solanum tuberosum]KAH0648443.1 hypothetical protein KY285_033691 [Solanum tuberosum]
MKHSLLGLSRVLSFARVRRSSANSRSVVEVFSISSFVPRRFSERGMPPHSVIKSYSVVKFSLLSNC